MAKERFKITDVVKVPALAPAMRKNWVIMGFASAGSEARLLRFPCCTQMIVKLSELKLQLVGEEITTPELEVKSLMDDGLGPRGRHPMSRDFWQSDITCKATTCVSNNNNMCTTPSLAKIGVDGKCEGHRRFGNENGNTKTE